jgi:glycosyltransferase involved in cell wall biosynthesis
MKVLIVCSGNIPNFNFKKHRPFIYEQIESLKNGFDIEYETFFIKGEGLFGYIKNFIRFRKKINKYLPDLIHAHYGLSGLLANLQRKIPVITSFHGSDINSTRIRPFSRLAAHLSKQNIFVSVELAKLLKASDNNAHIIPCGVNSELFIPLESQSCRIEMGLALNKKYILFSSSFDNSVKNFQLAEKAVANLKRHDVEIIELKGYSRNQVVKLMNGANLALLTSFSEGSPQFIKEAMACNCPIVSTDVGDVRKLFGNLDGHYITSFHPGDVAEKINMALEYSDKFKQTNGRERILDLQLNSESIALKIKAVYDGALSK